MNILQSFNLSGKVALVTGGSGLYGRQIVTALSKSGAQVYTASRNIEKNREFAAELSQTGVKIYAESYDQGDEQSIQRLADRILEKKGKVDILVNNSVLRIMDSYMDNIEKFQESMRINATGLFAVSRVFGEIMKTQNSGSIINIGSYMGLLGPDDTLYKNVSFSGFSAPDYFFHKAGMTNYTRFLASLYGPYNVRCNVISAGGLFNNQDKDFLQRYNERTFLKRMANDTDLQGAIVFLASDASAYVTGSVLTVDGGYSAK